MILSKNSTEYCEFLSIDDATSFGRSYFGDFCSDYQFGSKLHSLIISSGFDSFGYMYFDEDNKQEYLQKRQDYSCANAIANYCGNYSDMINSSLRCGDKSFDNNCIYKDISSTLDNILQAQQIPINIITYRMVGYEYVLSMAKGKLKSGTTIEDFAYMSTGLVYSKLCIEHPRDAVLRIKVPAGSNGLYLEFLSHRPNEQEVLLPRQTKLKVLSVKKYFCNPKIIDCIVI